jgi:DNA polymerase-3 subunit gamma/tau
MGYLVLARKYRPQGFADMTGQEHVVQTLSNAMNSGRVAHAHLFCGPRGCGKTTTARIVAKALNCEKGPTPNPCGVCTPCIEIAAGSDVDVQEIDAASNTGVDNVRDLRESAKYLPARDRFKIFIVDEVHMLSKAAFNAFLKTLEEPPGHVKFLFATTDPQALPDTILSRCQRHNFRLVPLKQISERIQSIALKEQVTMDDGAVALVARQAAGSMRDALSILDQLFSSVPPGVAITEAMAAQALGALDRGVVSELAAALLARDPARVLQSVARAYDGGHDLKRLAEDLATHARNLIAAAVPGAPLDLPDHEIRDLRTQASGADPVELSRLFDLVHAALGDMSRAAQPRHALEIALLKAVYLAPASSVSMLLARTDELAKRLGVATPPVPPGGGGGGPPAPGGGRPRPSFDAPAAATAAASTPTFTPSTARPTFTAEAAPSPAAAVPAIASAAVTPVPMPVPNPVPTSSAAVAVPAPSFRPPAPKPTERSPWERHLSLVPGGEGPSRPPAPAAVPPAMSSAPTEPIVPVAAAPVTAGPVEAPPAPVVARDEALAARWPAVVRAVRERRPSMGSLLEHARPMSFADGVLTLGFAPNDFHAQSLAGSARDVEGLLGEALGAPVKLAVVTVAARDGVATLAESMDQAEREAQAGRLKLGREHPAILEAVRILNAELEEVRDLGGVG